MAMGECSVYSSLQADSEVKLAIVRRWPKWYLSCRIVSLTKTRLKSFLL